MTSQRASIAINTCQDLPLLRKEFKRLERVGVIDPEVAESPYAQMPPSSNLTRTLEPASALQILTSQMPPPRACLSRPSSAASLKVVVSGGEGAASLAKRIRPARTLFGVAHAATSTDSHFYCNRTAPTSRPVGRTYTRPAASSVRNRQHGPREAPNPGLKVAAQILAASASVPLMGAIMPEVVILPKGATASKGSINPLTPLISKLDPGLRSASAVGSAL